MAQRVVSVSGAGGPAVSNDRPYRNSNNMRFAVVDGLLPEAPGAKRLDVTFKAYQRKNPEKTPLVNSLFGLIPFSSDPGATQTQVCDLVGTAMLLRNNVVNMKPSEWQR